MESSACCLAVTVVRGILAISVSGRSRLLGFGFGLWERVYALFMLCALLLWSLIMCFRCSVHAFVLQAHVVLYFCLRQVPPRILSPCNTAVRLYVWTRSRARCPGAHPRLGVLLLRALCCLLGPCRGFPDMYGSISSRTFQMSQATSSGNHNRWGQLSNEPAAGFKLIV